MKKWCMILTITLGILLCACQQKTVQETTSAPETERPVEASSVAESVSESETEQSAGTEAATAPETEQPVETEAELPSVTEPASAVSVPALETELAEEPDAPVPYGEAVTFSGYQLQDGVPAAITASMKIEGVLRGEEAYAALLESDPQLAPPEEGKEYIVVTVQVSYEEGEAEELLMYENIASLPSASRYFAMSGSYGNAENLTASLPDSIYNCVIKAGESAEGRAAFLHGTGENEPLIFAGFEQVLRFSLAS